MQCILELKIKEDYSYFLGSFALKSSDENFRVSQLPEYNLFGYASI